MKSFCLWNAFEIVFINFFQVHFGIIKKIVQCCIHPPATRHIIHWRSPKKCILRSRKLDGVEINLILVHKTISCNQISIEWKRRQNASDHGNINNQLVVGLTNVSLFSAIRESESRKLWDTFWCFALNDVGFAFCRSISICVCPQKMRLFTCLRR